MRPVFRLLSITLWLVPLTASAQWKQVIVGSPENKITCVYFNEYGVGFLGMISITGSPASVWRSTDVGASWQPTSIDYSHTAFGFPLAEDFTFKDANTGWFASRYGSYRTDDGGLTWSYVGSTSALDQTRSIFYDRTSATLIRSTWASNISISTDDGNTWRVTDNSTPGMNGFAQMDDTTLLVGNGSFGFGYYPTLLSSDHGRSWKEVTRETETWQPYCNRDKRYFLLAHDNGADLLKSTDRGATWRKIAPFPNDLDALEGCIRADSRGRVYAQMVYTGFYMSSDDGESWQDICGPHNGFDTRFCIFDDTLFCGDDAGNLWMLDLRTSNRLTADSALGIEAPDCHTTSRFLHLGHNFSCGTTVVLDSISVAGSAFSVRYRDALPAVIEAADSLLALYTPSGDSDSAIVTLHLRVGGMPVDTAITLFGRLDPTFDGLVTLELVAPDGSRAEAVRAGEDASVSLRMKHHVAEAIGLHQMSCVIRLPAALSMLDIQAAPGWSVSTSALPGQVRVRIAHTASGDIEAGEEIVRLRLRALLTVDTLAKVALDSVQFNPREVFSGCIALSDAFETVTVAITDTCGDALLRQFLRTGSPLVIESVYPDPVKDVLTVVVGPHSVARDFQVFDILGHEVLSAEFRGRLDVSQLSAGAYYLRLRNGAEAATRRFAVER